MLVSLLHQLTLLDVEGVLPEVGKKSLLFETELIALYLCLVLHKGLLSHHRVMLVVV